MKELIITIKSDVDLTNDIIKNKLNSIDIEDPIYVHKISTFTNEDELDSYIDDECSKDKIVRHINKLLNKNNPNIDKSIVMIFCWTEINYKNKIIEI